MSSISISLHAGQRMGQRNITPAMIAAACAFGERIYARNTLCYFLGKHAVKRLSEVDPPKHPERWEGLVLVCDSKTETLLTCFKNKKWLKKIRHK